MKRRGWFLLLILGLAVLIAAWGYWNRPRRDDLSRYAGADSLAFVEINNLADVINGLTDTDAWRSLSRPLGAPSRLAPSGWVIWLARWTGIGSADALLFARSQVAVSFSGADGTQTADTLTIKPLATFIIETHTNQPRMRAAVERHLEDLARRVYHNPVFVRKQNLGVELNEWQSPDATRSIVFTFAGTAVIMSNDEPSVLSAIAVREGKGPSLTTTPEFSKARQNRDTNAAVFGFVSQSGVKSLLQAYALYRGASSPDAVTAARIFSDMIGGLISSATWESKFVEGTVEDRCGIVLAPDVAEKLRPGMVPERGPNISNTRFVPFDAYSVSLYRLRDPASFWSDLNATVASHTDVIGAIAARPLLQSLLKPYGIADVGAFARAIGPEMQTVRVDENASAVWISEVFDGPALRRLISSRFPQDGPTETVGGNQLLTSALDNRAAAFVDNYFLIGPTESIRRCLQAKAQSQSIASGETFRKAQRLIDVSQPATVLTFSNDQRQAVSVVEFFTPRDRSAFPRTGSQIDSAMKQLPDEVSVSILKGSELEWTSRSAFGLLASLLVQLAPETK